MEEQFAQLKNHLDSTDKKIALLENNSALKGKLITDMQRTVTEVKKQIADMEKQNTFRKQIGDAQHQLIVKLRADVSERDAKIWDLVQRLKDLEKRYTAAASTRIDAAALHGISATGFGAAKDVGALSSAPSAHIQTGNATDDMRAATETDADESIETATEPGEPISPTPTPTPTPTSRQKRNAKRNAKKKENKKRKKENATAEKAALEDASKNKEDFTKTLELISSPDTDQDIDPGIRGDV